MPNGTKHASVKSYRDRREKHDTRLFYVLQFTIREPDRRDDHN